MKTTRDQGRRTGPGLKPGVNEADTFGVVHQVRGVVKFGRMAMGGDGNSPSRNKMMSGNSSRKK